MDGFTPIQERETVKVVTPPNQNPANLLMAFGLFAGAGVGAAYYAGKLNRNITVLLAGGSAIPFGIGAHKRLTNKPTETVKQKPIEPIPSKPFVEQGKLSTLLKIFYPKKAKFKNSEARIGEGQNYLYGASTTQDAGARDRIVTHWLENLAQARGMRLGQVIVPHAEKTTIKDAPVLAFEKMALSAWKGVDQYQDDPEFQKTCYELATLIVKTGWSNVRHDTLLLTEKKAALLFAPEYSGALEGLTGGGDTPSGKQGRAGLLNIVPLNIAKALIPLLPGKLASLCKPTIDWRETYAEYLATEVTLNPVLAKAVDNLGFGAKGSGISEHEISASRKECLETGLFYQASGYNRVFDCRFKKGKDDEHLRLIIEN